MRRNRWKSFQTRTRSLACARASSLGTLTSVTLRRRRDHVCGLECLSTKNRVQAIQHVVDRRGLHGACLTEWNACPCVRVRALLTWITCCALLPEHSEEKSALRAQDPKLRRSVPSWKKNNLEWFSSKQLENGFVSYKFLCVRSEHQYIRTRRVSFRTA